MRIKIGTRKSNLALRQTEIAIEQFKKLLPELECDIVKIQTSGDKITDRNLYDIGGKALFLKELEEKLLAGEIDIAVHSLKDVPGIIDPRLIIAATLEREDPRDCFLSHKYTSLASIPKNGLIGSSSMRRKTIIKQIRPDLRMQQFRGNIHTRLQKLANHEVDATILAYAGLKRANLFNPAYCHLLEVNQMLPAAGQGVIALQTKLDDIKMQNLCNLVNHQATWHLSLAERSFLTYLDASCKTPIAAYAYYQNNYIKAHYMLADDDGSNVRYSTQQGTIAQASKLGVRAAKLLL